MRKLSEIFGMPSDASGTIHVKSITEDGIFCLGGGRYSVSYGFQDINYISLSREDREKTFLMYEELLNSLDPATQVFITVSRKKQDLSEVKDRLLRGRKGDGLDKLRKQYDEIILESIRQGDEFLTERYLTVSTEKRNINEARTFFTRNENDMRGYFHSLGSEITRLGSTERLRIIGIMSPDPGYVEETLIDRKRKRGEGISSFISPDYLRIGTDHLEFDDRYVRALYLRDYPSYMKDSFLGELADTCGTFMMTIKIKPVAVDKALRETEKRLLGIETNITNWQKRQNRERNLAAVLPFDMEQQREELKEFLNDLMNRDQKMFLSGMTMLVMADTMEELDSLTEGIQQTGRKHLMQIGVLRYRQLEGMNEALPLGNSETEVWRTLTSEALSAFIPFRCMDVEHESGIWYGNNRISRNIIRIDRNRLLNGNEFILGVSGSGKSFFAKNEILQSFLYTDADIIIIDPEREYSSLTRTLGGEVIEISSMSRTHINPMELSPDDPEENVLSEKSGFLMGLMEALKGGSLSARERSVIDRCTGEVYADLLSGKKDNVPLLKDLYHRFLRQEEEEGKELALALEMFSKGSIDCFSQKTNVDTGNRLICFDIYELGKQMAGAGMLIVLDSIMNRIKKNRNSGRNTLIYIDEIYLLFRNEYSSEFLFGLWKRVRKYGAYAIGITQNVEDLLESQKGRAMLSNSELLIMFSQAQSDRIKLKELISFSDSEEKFLLGTGEGEGLIRIGRIILPIKLDISSESELFLNLSGKNG